MSLFITDLALSEDSLVEAAKLGILGVSLVAGVVGWTILRGTSRPR
jgi:Na+:H+ antiporter, NhaA family